MAEAKWPIDISLSHGARFIANALFRAAEIHFWSPIFAKSSSIFGDLLHWYKLMTNCTLSSKTLPAFSLPHPALGHTHNCARANNCPAAVGATPRRASDNSFVVSNLPQPLRHSRARLPDRPQEDDDKAGRRHRQVSGERA